MKHKPTPKTYELTDDLIEQCRAAFEADPTVRELNIKHERLRRAGWWAEANRLAEKKKALFDKVLVAYEEQLAAGVEKMALTAADLPREDVKKLETLFVTIEMVIDILDSCLLDVNDIVHRTNKDFSLEQWDNMHELSQVCRSEIKSFGSTQKFLSYGIWGDTVDDMYTMMQNKAKSIIKKTNEQEKQKND